MSTGSIVRRIVLMGVVLCTLYLVFHALGLTTIRTTIEESGIWAPVVLLGARIASFIFLILPGAPIYLAAGALLGLWEAVAILTLGDIIGGTITFYISRVFGRDVVNKLMPHRGALEHAMTLLGTTRGFLLARVVFIPVQEIPCYAAGLTQLSYFRFILIHAVVGFVPTVLIVSLGTSAAALSAMQFYILAAAGIVLIPVSVYVAQYVFRHPIDTRRDL